jgi:ketosteroid isomerase-like protein
MHRHRHSAILARVSLENEEVVRAMYAAFRGDNPADALPFYSEDVLLDATERPDGTIARGRENLGSMIGDWVSEFEDWSEEVEEISARGDDGVLFVATQRGRGKASGIVTEGRYAVAYRIRDGLIAEMKLYRDPDEAKRDLET